MMIDDREGDVDGDASDNNGGDGSEDDDEAAGESICYGLGFRARKNCSFDFCIFSNILGLSWRLGFNVAVMGL